jgi:hypothetical protein
MRRRLEGRYTSGLNGFGCMGMVQRRVWSGAWGVVSVAETGRVWPHRLASCAGVRWSRVRPPYTPVVLPQPSVYFGRLCREPPVVIGVLFRRYADV